MTFDVVGDGPAMAALRAQSAREGVDGATRFHGWLPQERAAEVMGGANLLLFPSIREFGGAVVMEAMAMGLCPLVVDYGGPGEYVRDGVGYKVPLGSREEIVAALHARLQQLARAPEQVAEAGARAREAVLSDYTWSAKARQVAAVYAWVLAGAPPPAPSFFASGDW